MLDHVQHQIMRGVTWPWHALQRVVSRRRRRSSVYTPKLARLWLVLPIWLAAGAGLIWLINQYVRTNEALIGTNTPQIEITKVVLTLTAGVGAVLAGVYAYRKQRLEEGSSHRDDAASFADRYNSAVEQLGSDTAAIRLAGAYAMARLADDWVEQRQVCVDVLCGYLRMQRPSGPDTKDLGQEQEVRATIQTLIATHLRDPLDPRSWSLLNFNLERARLVNLDLSEAIFSGSMTSFTEATFTGDWTSFDEATFASDTTSFDKATFSGAKTSFGEATFASDMTSFGEATFASDMTFFGEATFSGWTTFSKATFASDTTSFDKATFSGAKTSFGEATFSGEKTTFHKATFSEDKTSFVAATFSGNTTTFHTATFASDTTTFDEATFSSDLTTFVGASFSSNTTTFDGATFSSNTTTFDGATFSSNTTTFDEATFSGTNLSLPLNSFHGLVTFHRSTWQGPGAFSFEPTSTAPPSATLRVTWTRVNLLNGARVTLDGKPFNGWPPSHTAGRE